jgi:hypothetical protein
MNPFWIDYVRPVLVYDIFTKNNQLVQSNTTTTFCSCVKSAVMRSRVLWLVFALGAEIHGTSQPEASQPVGPHYLSNNVD